MSSDRSHAPAIQIAPSILAADWTAFRHAATVVATGGADVLHLDVMDGHFVPEITFGRQLVATLRPLTSLPFDVHLMVQNPGRHVGPMIEAGANQVTVHLEASPELDTLQRVLADIRARGAKAGVALRPLTPARLLDGLWDAVDLVLVMTVEPGYSGQQFKPELLPKIEAIAARAAAQPQSPIIAVDGGIDVKTAELVAAAGATFLVAGSSVYGAADPATAITMLRRAAERGAIRRLM